MSDIDKLLDDDRMVRGMCETVAENSPGAAAAMALVLATYNAKVAALEMLRIQVGRTEMALEHATARCMDLEGGKDALRATIARVRAIAESSAGIVAEAVRVALRPPDELPEHWKAFYRRTGTPLPKATGDDVTDDRLRGKERLIINGVPFVVESAIRATLDAIKAATGPG